MNQLSKIVGDSISRRLITLLIIDLIRITVIRIGKKIANILKGGTGQYFSVQHLVALFTEYG